MVGVDCFENLTFYSLHILRSFFREIQGEIFEEIQRYVEYGASFTISLHMAQ